MSLLTTWGYTLTEMYALEEMITRADFAVYTEGKYAKHSEQIEEEIRAASMAVRNYVGWHLYPEAACAVQMTMQDGRIARVGQDLLIQLPAKYVTAVGRVTVDGTEREHSFTANGILRVYDVPPAKRFAPVAVSYTAGLPDALMDSVRELIAHRVTHTLAVPSGITSESSGGVSVTYNANWINSARATALPDDNKEVLAPYRVQGVF